MVSCTLQARSAFIADLASLRRIHCFENVTAILFLAAVSGYDVNCTSSQIQDPSLTLIRSTATIARGQGFGSSQRSLCPPPRSILTFVLHCRTKCKKPSCSSTRSATRNGSYGRPSSSSSTKCACLLFLLLDSRLTLCAEQVDIFKERILVSSIKANFPDYTGEPRLALPPELGADPLITRQATTRTTAPLASTLKRDSHG